MRPRRRRSLVPLVVSIALLAAACGDSTPTTAGPTDDGATTGTPEAPEPDAPSDLEVACEEDGGEFEAAAGPARRGRPLAGSCTIIIEPDPTNPGHDCLDCVATVTLSPDMKYPVIDLTHRSIDVDGTPRLRVGWGDATSFGECVDGMCRHFGSAGSPNSEPYEVLATRDGNTASMEVPGRAGESEFEMHVGDGYMPVDFLCAHVEVPGPHGELAFDAAYYVSLILLQQLMQASAFLAAMAAT